MQHDDFEPLRGRRVPRVKRDLARQYRHNSTEAERVLWERLRGRGLDGARFRRQHVIAGFIVDFYCHTARLAVEVDGAVHARQVAYDAERDEALVARGVRVLRFSNDAVLGDVEEVLQVIASALTPQPPLPEGEGEPERPHPSPLPAGEGEPERPHPSPLPAGEGEPEADRAGACDGSRHGSARKPSPSGNEGG